MITELDNFRKKYPQYSDIDDATLANRLAAKYPDAYSDLPSKIISIPEVNRSGLAPDIQQMKPDKSTNPINPMLESAPSLNWMQNERQQPTVQLPQIVGKSPGVTYPEVTIKAPKGFNLSANLPQKTEQIKLSPQEETKFAEDLSKSEWFKQLSKDYPDVKPADLLTEAINSKEYDYRSAWRQGIKPELNKYDNKLHFPDKDSKGNWLKLAGHPTAWMENFMEITGKDPGELNLNTIEDAQKWLDVEYPKIIQDELKYNQLPQPQSIGQSPEELQKFQYAKDLAGAVTQGENIFFGGVKGMTEGAEKIRDAVNNTKDPALRRLGLGLTGALQLGFNLIPDVMAINTVAPISGVLAGGTGKLIGGEAGQQIGETLNSLGIAATFGAPMLVGTLTSMGAEKLAQKIVKGSKLSQEDKDLVSEVAGHLGFVAGLFGAKLGSKLTAKYSDKVAQALYKPVMEEMPANIKGNNLTPEGIKYFQDRLNDPATTPAEKQTIQNILAKETPVEQPMPEQQGIKGLLPAEIKPNEVQNAERIGAQVEGGSQKEGAIEGTDSGLYLRDNAKNGVETGKELTTLFDNLGARYEGQDSNGNLSFTNYKTGGTFTIKPEEVTPKNIIAILKNDKNKPLLEPKANKEDLQKIFKRKQPYEMTREEFEKSEQPYNFGDYYITPDGKFGVLRGSSGMGSDRVRLNDINGAFIGHYNRSELKPISKAKFESSASKAADEWLQDVSSKIQKLKDDNSELLLKKGIYEKFKNNFADEKFKEYQKNNKVISDADYNKALDIEEQIQQVRDTPISVPENKEHKKNIEKALSEGKFVPENVLKDYPDLQKAFEENKQVAGQSVEQPGIIDVTNNPVENIPIAELPSETPIAEESYKLQHQIKEPITTADALTKAAPEDLFDNFSDYYDLTDPAVKESYRRLKSIQGNPDAEVTIYRSVPKGIDKINEGDWVSLSPKYAKEEGLHPTDVSQDMPVISMKVKANDIGWDGNDINEFVYSPKGKSWETPITEQPQTEQLYKGESVFNKYSKEDLGESFDEKGILYQKKGKNDKGKFKYEPILTPEQKKLQQNYGIIKEKKTDNAFSNLGGDSTGIIIDKIGNSLSEKLGVKTKKTGDTNSQYIKLPNGNQIRISDHTGYIGRGEQKDYEEYPVEFKFNNKDEFKGLQAGDIFYSIEQLQNKNIYDSIINKIVADNLPPKEILPTQENNTPDLSRLEPVRTIIEKKVGKLEDLSEPEVTNITKALDAKYPIKELVKIGFEPSEAKSVVAKVKEAQSEQLSMPMGAPSFKGAEDYLKPKGKGEETTPLFTQPSEAKGQENLFESKKESYPAKDKQPAYDAEIVSPNLIKVSKDGEDYYTVTAKARRDAQGKISRGGVLYVKDENLAKQIIDLTGGDVKKLKDLSNEFETYSDNKNYDNLNESDEALKDFLKNRKRIFTEDAYKAAKERLNSLKGKLYDVGGAIADAAAFTKDLAIVGGYHIESGLKTFAEWSKKMVEEFGDKVKPYLADVWNTIAKEHPNILEGGEELTALNKAEIKSLREEFGLDELEPVKRKTILETVNKVKEDNLIVSANDIANDIVVTKRSASDVEHVAMVLKADELRDTANGYTKTISDLIESGDKAGAVMEKARRELVLEQIDQLTRAAEYSGTDLSRAFGIRRLRVKGEDFTIASILQRVRANKGEVLTDKETARFEALAKDYEKLQKELDDVKANAEKIIAEQEKKIAERIAEREIKNSEIIRKSRTAKDKIATERNDIKKQLKMLGFRVNDISSLTAEGSYLVGKLAVSYIKEGAVNLNEVVQKVLNDVPDITERDVYRALNAKDPKAKVKARTEAVKKVALFKRQAQLIEDIRNAEEGIFKDKKTRPITAPEIASLQKQLAKLRIEAYRADLEAGQLDRAVKRLNEIQDQFTGIYRNIKKGKQPVPEAVQNVRKQTAEILKEMNLDDKISDLKEQLRTGEFKIKTPPVEKKPAPVEIQKKEVKLYSLRKRIREAERQMMPPEFKEKVQKYMGILRTLQLSYDMGATLRNALMPTVQHPIMAANVQRKAIAAFFSENRFEEIQYGIENSPIHYLRQKAGLAISDMDTAPSHREEMFYSDFMEKVPWYGKGIRASNRHMVTTLNLLRVGMFDKFVQDYPNATDDELKAWAHYINIATGRGDLGDFSNAATILSTVFLAPRFTISRIETPFMLAYHWKEPRVRKEIAKNYAALATFGLSVLSLAALAGAKVATNPDDPDFLKMRFGDTRIDVFGGLLQPMRLIFKLGKMGTTRLGLTKPSKYKEDPLEVLGRFAAYKLAPPVTLAYELITGKNIIGQKEQAWEIAVRNVMPMVAQDITDALRSENPEDALWIAPLSFFGVSVNTYKKKQKSLQRSVR